MKTKTCSFANLVTKSTVVSSETNIDEIDNGAVGHRTKASLCSYKTSRGQHKDISTN